MTKQTNPCRQMDILQRIGDETVFAFTIRVLVERLQSDPKLKKYFANFIPINLIAHQTQVLTAAFSCSSFNKGSASSPGVAASKTDAFILLRYYALIESGFNREHFKLVIKHFKFALEDAWVDEDVIRDAVRILSSFSGIFEKESFKLVKTTKNDGAATDATATNENRSWISYVVPRNRGEETNPPAVGRSFSSGDGGVLKMMRLKASRRNRQVTLVM